MPGGIAFIPRPNKERGCVVARKHEPFGTETMSKRRRGFQF